MRGQAATRGTSGARQRGRGRDLAQILVGVPGNQQNCCRHRDSVSANEFPLKKGTNSFGATAGNGRDAAPPHCAVPGALFPGRVSTSSAGDGAT